MKFIHIADVHLGASPDAGKAYSGTRSREIWETFKRVLEQCEKEKTDLLLVAGDLFHRQPLLKELKEVNYLFSRLTHTKVVLIAGNHDYVKQDSYYRTFQWGSNVFPLLQERLKGVRFPELKTAVYGFSYYEREIREARYQNAAAPRLERYEILLAHGGDEKHIPIRPQELLRLGYEYVALGHIHMPQELLENRVRYAGALEPVDTGDVGVHGYVAGEITGKGIRTRFVPFAVREYKKLSVKMDPEMTKEKLLDELKRQIGQLGEKHLYKIYLEGLRSPEFDFREEWIDPYGNVVEWKDGTTPAYPFTKLCRSNADNLLGKYIVSFSEADTGSVEYEALCEGVHALLATKRG